MNRFLSFALLCILLFFSDALFAQSNYKSYDQDYYHTVERYEIRRGRFSESFHSVMKPYKRAAIAHFADTLLDDEFLDYSPVDEFNLMYLANDNWRWSKKDESKSEKPFMKYIYRRKPDFYHDQVDYFQIHANPILHFGLGFESDAEASGNLFVNTRGATVRGVIGDKIGFYSSVLENQARYPLYVRNYTSETGAVPGYGFWKDFNEDGVDFLEARGYFTFKIAKVIDFAFGHDRHFIGNGYRSLALSDFSNPYLFAKLNTQVWKIKYTNLFAQLTADVQRANNVFPKKYMTMHHLSINLLENLNIGIFETIIFARDDNRKNDTVELGYLNPIIFYRSVEQNLGSADNAMLGLDLKWNFLNAFQLYGQVVLDEFVLSEVTSGEGWWANKQGVQLGMKYVDAFGISNLDLQGEFNSVRPYMYSHFGQNALASYSNFNQAMAHPLGANFREFIGVLRYQPSNKLRLTGRLIYSEYGEDPNGQNWGSNILADNVNRPMEYGHTIGQGINTQQLFASLTASYMLKHNLFVDLQAVYRDKQSEVAARSFQTNFASLSVRWNLAQGLHEF